MSIHQTTIAHFMSLTIPHLRLAIRLCDEEIKTLSHLNIAGGPADAEYHAQLDELSTAITLRKVHQVRLEELEAEANETDGSSVPSALAA